MEKASAGILKERPRPKNERLVLPWMWVRTERRALGVFQGVLGRFRVFLERLRVF